MSRASARNTAPPANSCDISLLSLRGRNSYVHLDHLLHPDETADGEAGGAHEHHLADAVLEERADVGGVERPHHEGHARGEQGQHDGAHAPFGRQRLDVTTEALTL